MLDGICKSAKLKAPVGDDRDQILDAATGMTCTEAENAYALAETVPLSKLMAEQIAGLKKWSQGRCRMATSPVKVEQGRRSRMPR